MVLAISGLLLIMAFSGQREVRERAQFSAAVEQVKNNVVKVKNEANTTVHLDALGTGDRLFFGKRIRFTPNSSSLEVTTLTADRNDLSATLVESPVEYTIDVPYGVRYADPQRRSVIFTRRESDGQLITYTPDTPVWTPPPPVNFSRDPDRYRPDDASLRGDLVLRFEDDAGRAATVTVNGLTGAVTRVIN